MAKSICQTLVSHGKSFLPGTWNRNSIVDKGFPYSICFEKSVLVALCPPMLRHCSRMVTQHISFFYLSRWLSKASRNRESGSTLSDVEQSVLCLSYISIFSPLQFTSVNQECSLALLRGQTAYFDNNVMLKKI